MSGKDMIAAMDALELRAGRCPMCAVPFAVDSNIDCDHEADSYRVWLARLPALIAAEIEQFADDDSDVSDAYRHAALIAKGTQP